jgi:hypothetical protein
MFQFSTVKKACAFLSMKNGQSYTFKYEMLHGQRFYFVWRADSLPFNQRQNTLICRGDKKEVLAKLERIANAPELPSFV